MSGVSVLTKHHIIGLVYVHSFPGYVLGIHNLDSDFESGGHFVVAVTRENFTYANEGVLSTKLCVAHGERVRDLLFHVLIEVGAYGGGAREVNFEIISLRIDLEDQILIVGYALSALSRLAVHVHAELTVDIHWKLR